MFQNDFDYSYDESILNSSIRKVFLWMILGLSLTIGTMFSVVMNPALANFVFKSFQILIIGELVLVLHLVLL